MFFPEEETLSIAGLLAPAFSLAKKQLNATSIFLLLYRCYLSSQELLFNIWNLKNSKVTRYSDKRGLTLLKI